MRALRSATALLVWLGWAALTGAAVRTVIRDARNIPLAGDWNLVPAMTGHEADMGGLLWSAFGTERQPLPRLVALGALGMARDVRAATVLAIVTLAAVAAMLLVTLHRLRGRPRVADLLIPIVLLQPAQWAGTGGAELLQATIPVALICVMLLAVVSDPVLRTRRWTVLGGAGLLLLPLSGLAGVIVALAVAPWFGACGWRHWPPRDAGVPRQRGPSLLTIVMGAMVLVGIYFSGCQPDAWNTVSPGTPPFRDAALFLARALGPATTVRTLPALVGVAIATVATWLVLARAWTRVADDERHRALGIILLLLGLALVIIAWGSGAAGQSPTAALVAVPLVLVTYLAWELYAPAIAAVGFETLLLVAVLLAVPANFRQGADWRATYRQTTDALTRDIAAGVSWPALATRYGRFLDRGAAARELSDRMAMLGDARIGPFARAKPRASPAPDR